MMIMKIRTADSSSYDPKDGPNILMACSMFCELEVLTLAMVSYGLAALIVSRSSALALDCTTAHELGGKATHIANMASSLCLKFFADEVGHPSICSIAIRTVHNICCSRFIIVHRCIISFSLTFTSQLQNTVSKCDIFVCIKETIATIDNFSQ